MSVELSNPFINSVKKILMEMANIDVAVTGAVSSGNDAVVSYGVTSIVACVGKIKGRLLLDMEQSLAVAIAENITGVVYASAKEYMVLACVSEVNNIIAGDAITVINNQFPLGLRLAPPIVLTGKDVVVSIPKISSSSLDCKTKYGKLKINVAFERGL
jgi:chemotaxis protein CheX